MTYTKRYEISYMVKVSDWEWTNKCRYATTLDGARRVVANLYKKGVECEPFIHDRQTGERIK